MTSRERTAFARAARFWRNEVRLTPSILEHVNFVESLEDRGAWWQREGWKRIAEIAESLSLDGMDHWRVP